MAAYIPSEFIQDLLNRIDIVEVIDHRVPLKKAGKNFVACCPFHDEKTPSFSVSAQKQMYYCFGCGQGGDAIKFLIEYDGVNFVEAIEDLARQAGVDVPRQQQQAKKAVTQVVEEIDLYQLLTRVAHHFQAQFKQAADARLAIDYLKQRGITGEIAKKYQVGFAPAGWDHLLKAFPGEAMRTALVASGMVIHNEQGRYYDRYRQRIMFPILDRRGRVVGFGGRVINSDDSPKYLNSPETVVFHKNRELYGLYQALQIQRAPDYLLVVEGYMDVIGLAQYGIYQAVAALGTAISQTHIQLLTRHTRKIIFCMDGDNAGQQAAWRALEVALPILTDEVQVQFLFLPQGEDPDSLIRQQGSEKFLTCMEQAQPLTDYLFEQLLQQTDIQQMEGRAYLIGQLSRFVKNMTAHTLKQLIIERLAQLVHLPVARVTTLLEQGASTKGVISSVNKPVIKSLTPMQLAIALLLQNPGLVTYIDLENVTLAGVGGQLLKEMVEFIRQHPNINTQGLLHQWREAPEAAGLVKLAAWELAIPDSGMAAELMAVLSRLSQEYLQQQVNYLLKQGRQTPLTSEQQEELNRLLQQLKAKSP
ncbi:MAG: DNA primase [Legionellales bacterium]|nr:DNA primase [Legionellales bacterium]